MTELLKCNNCGLVWKYPGYPHYIGCPNCDSINQKPVNHEAPCPYCKGTGKVQTNEIEGDMSYAGMKKESPEWLFAVNKDAIEKIRKEKKKSNESNRS